MDLTSETCSILFKQRDSLADGGWADLGKFTYSLEDAKRVGLVKTGSSWEKYPSNMLFARAISSGVRIYCPDVFNGVVVYTPDEFGADVDDDGEVIAVPAAPPMSQEEVKQNANKYVQIHGDDGAPDKVQALLIQNAKLQQRAADLHIPGLRQFNAQSVWPVDKIEAANAEVNARIIEREEELDAREALAGQVELPA